MKSPVTTSENSGYRVVLFDGGVNNSIRVGQISVQLVAGYTL